MKETKLQNNHYTDLNIMKLIVELRISCSLAKNTWYLQTWDEEKAKLSLSKWSRQVGKCKL